MFEDKTLLHIKIMVISEFGYMNDSVLNEVMDIILSAVNSEKFNEESLIVQAALLGLMRVSENSALFKRILSKIVCNLDGIHEIYLIQKLIPKIVEYSVNVQDIIITLLDKKFEETLVRIECFKLLVELVQINDVDDYRIPDMARKLWNEDVFSHLIRLYEKKDMLYVDFERSFNKVNSIININIRISKVQIARKENGLSRHSQF